MTLSLTSLLISAIIGVVVWLIAKRIPYVATEPLPVLLGLLAGILAYLGSFNITL
jgi:hypothetical protein